MNNQTFIVELHKMSLHTRPPKKKKKKKRKEKKAWSC